MKEPEADRKRWTFGQLLKWHMDRGTRPDGTPERRGRRWNQVDLGSDCRVSDHAVRAWCSDEYPPDDIETVERVLFGATEFYDPWRTELREAWARARQPGSPRDHAIDPPTLCLGRDADVSLLLAALKSPKDTIAIVLGQAGIGKTTLTCQVAASPELARRFGTRRWFIALDAAPDAVTFRERIIVALGLRPGEPAAFDQALRLLREKPALLVLDNLETPWEAAMEAIEADLGRLAAVPGLSLLVSARGAVPPGGAVFSEQVRLDPLSPPDSLALFRVHAPNISPADPDLNDFLVALGGIPLAIELIARRAVRHPNLSELWRQYQARGPELARHPHLPEGRLTSVIRSIDLSWQSSRLHQPGRHLFRLLGASPAGLADADREALLGPAAMEAMEQVLETGLAVARSGRLDLLPPVRGYAQAMQKLEGEERDR